MQKSTQESIEKAAKQVREYQDATKKLINDPSCDLIVRTTDKTIDFSARHWHHTRLNPKPYEKNIVHIWLWETRDLADTDVVYYLAEIKRGNLEATGIIVCSDFDLLFPEVFQTYQYSINDAYAITNTLFNGASKG